MRKDRIEMYPKLKMAPTTANSLLLSIISLQKLNAPHKKLNSVYVCMCVRERER